MSIFIFCIFVLTLIFLLFFLLVFLSAISYFFFNIMYLILVLLVCLFYIFFISLTFLPSNVACFSDFIVLFFQIIFDSNLSIFSKIVVLLEYSERQGIGKELLAHFTKWKKKTEILYYILHYYGPWIKIIELRNLSIYLKKCY